MKTSKEPELVVTSTKLDMELCELLGDTPSDFVILLADGEPVPGFGSPLDSPAARERYADLCRRLNETKVFWLEFKSNWGKALAEICPTKRRPVFSWQIHRVCAGYSVYRHCAIRLLEMLESRVRWWKVSLEEGVFEAELEMAGNHYSVSGKDCARVIALVVARALRENKTAPDNTNPTVVNGQIIFDVQ